MGSDVVAICPLRRSEGGTWRTVMHASLAVWSALHQVTIPSTWLPHTTAVTVTVRAAMMSWLGVPQPSPVIIMRAATTGLATVAEPVVHMRRRLVLRFLCDKKEPPGPEF